MLTLSPTLLSLAMQALSRSRSSSATEEANPACIESERIVMETGKTCVAEETVQTGDGTRLLTTYKSPLYNVDGVVMGTDFLVNTILRLIPN